MVRVGARSPRVVQNSSKTPEHLPRLRSGTFSHCLLTLVVTLASFGPLSAQDSIDDAVRVLPSAVGSTFASTRPVVLANVDLVLVNVTVLDQAGRAVSGLALTNFAVTDQKNRQTIKYLSNEDEPISLVVVLDVSASMATRVQQERRAFSDLVSTSNPQDDFCLIVVSDKPRIALHFDDPTSDMAPVVNTLQPDGTTALWDGMYLGIKELKAARHQRKAMVVISDGGDNHSRYTESELRSLLKEADAEVYAIGLFDRYATRIEEKKGPLQLDEVTSVTGGRVFSVHDAAQLSRAVTQISYELRNQYVLGYYPSDRSRDGKWRKLDIRLAGSASQAKLRLYTKKGYYAASE